MKTLEIIHVRSFGLSPEELSEVISVSLRQENAREEVVSMYCRDGLDTDLAVHIQRSDEGGPADGRELGLRLASALREFGVVKYTTWRRLG